VQFRIDNASGRPVYRQIIDQVKRDIALGRLVAGDKLPTVRELAGQLVINPNTIGKSYRQLEQDGVIVTRAGSGAFVAELDSTLSRSVRRKLICEQLERVVVEAVHMRIDKHQLVEWFNNTVEKFKFSGGKG